MDLPQYDEIHVISDIHMGGLPGFQILRETKRLAGFIRWVAAQRPAGRVALVLNGDIVDTLAEDIAGYVAIEEAVATIERIAKDPAFADIWNALSELVSTPGRTLVIVLGNHDVEFAFPPVQRFVQRRLAGDDLAARARIEFSTTGAGYACMVGRSRVYCTHGNEVDPWNYLRYEDLSKAARRLAAGRPLEPADWEPNAGTRMVKDVMNEVKQRFKWIDLMKPETSAAVGVLLVLDPKQLAKINRLVPIIGEKATGDREYDQRLSAGGFARPDAAVARSRSAEGLLGSHLAAALSGGAQQNADDLLLQAERNLGAGAAPTAAGPDGRLGTAQLIFDRLTGWLRNVSEAEALRRALKDWLAEDRTFAVTDEDDTYKAVLPHVGNDIDFIVTGHTHLERAIRVGPDLYYFNTGTWIRLLRYTDAMLADEENFTAVYQVLRDGTIEAIDRAEFHGKPLVLDQTSAVRIALDGNHVTGELAHVLGDGSSREVVQQFIRG